MIGFAQGELQLLTTREAAERLRVSEATLYRYLRTGRVPAVRVGELGPWRIPVDALEQLLRPEER